VGGRRDQDEWRYPDGHRDRSRAVARLAANSVASWQGEFTKSKMNIYRAGVANNFFNFYHIKILSGRGFSVEYSTDSASFIINQTTAKLLGWDDPIGKELKFQQDIGLKPIIGVIKDFNFHSLHLPVEPLALSTIGSKEYQEPEYLSIRVIPGSISEIRWLVESRLKQLSPHYLNSVTVLSDQIEEMYSSDRKLVTIFVFSTVIAVLLTCLGQFSLYSYTTKGRTKEMAIRKILGAQPSEIMKMILVDFVKLISISILFAWPVAYLLTSKWLQNFVYHIEIDVAVFIYSLIISLFISIAAIGYHVRNLSKVNPSVMISKE
jgi:putative ABC transport system permease protein